MYSQLILKNQFGEQSNNAVIGGSNQVWCSFIVDAANVNGLGIRGLKSDGSVANVYMHTSQTPDAGNPNPAVGFILVEFAKGFAGFLNGAYSLSAPNSGTPINVTTGVTIHLTYVITTLGTTSTAQWHILGVPANQAPAVGLVFVAPATTVATGTGTIQVVKAIGSGIDHLEIVGDPNVSVQTTDGTGGTMVLLSLAATSSSVTTFLATNPGDNTIIGLSLNLISIEGPLI